ncbi:MAG TPA: intein-containing Rv2578c family radical SAM protein [Streptosporangiaceae bacterium]
MRWDGIRIDTGGPGQPSAAGHQGATSAPALFERGAMARSFDTPGFRGMTFFEVHAKSIINRVPEASRVPFRWTINPYRGCSHGCVYCLMGGTPILMADGRTKPLANVRAGDAIYGTIRSGNYRRYVVTTVMAHWQTVKPAYRIMLEDGTWLAASGDHRFLSDRGWKHVIGAESGPLQRPHLTLNNKLMGVGAFAEPPKDSPDYRRGYLSGMIRGDGCISRARYRRADGSTASAPQFRLALTDTEALDRTGGYLARVGIGCTEFTFAEATSTRQRMAAIRCGGRDQIGVIEWLIGWPDSPTLDWRKGFLAGIFDAEGSHSGGILRISNTDPALLDWLRSCLRVLGFAFATERQFTARGKPLTSFRITGGLPEKLRFFLTTDPAITRKRSIEGTAIKNNARLGVTSIEPFGLDLPMFDITTGTGDFIANGVVSHNCFARNTHTYLDLDAGHDFDSKIVVKVNAPQLVRKELAARKWQGEHIAMGTNVDCYQRAEGRYQLMPGILRALVDARNPFSILTKGTLILRDLDLLVAAAEVTEVGLSVSAGCMDEDLWRTLESGTPSPRRRLGVCATLTEHGLPCGVLMGPVVPFLSDSPAQLEATVRQVAEAGATHVSPIVLHLRPGAREWFMAWLAEHHPALVPRYRGLYGGRAYAPKDYQRQISEQVRILAERHGVGRGRHGRRAWRAPPAVPPGRNGPDGSAAGGNGPGGSAEPVQLSLL